MGEISIKITIADRIYPLKVEADDEENIRGAAKMINDRIREFQENYAVKDKQDLLSMCVLQFATETLKMNKKNEDMKLSEKALHLDSLLNDYLSKQ